MAESNFVDYVKIYCRSGKGGRGSTHMRREKYVPNGGPDGGDGGRGGHVILRGNRNYWTLLHLKYERHAMAGHGESGSRNRSFGKDGQDKIVEVPCGTVVYNAETGEYICDVTEHDQEVVLLKGGRGGLGNWHFRTATRQAPRFAALMMGIWYLSMATANKFAGLLSGLYPEDGKAKSILGIQIETMSDFFMIFVVMSGIAALILFLLSKKLQKMMHGVE